MTTIQIRVDEELKKSAQEVFKKTGLDMSSAIKLFLQQTVNRDNLPFFPTTDVSNVEMGLLKEGEITAELIKKIKETSEKDDCEFVNL